MSVLIELDDLNQLLSLVNNLANALNAVRASIGSPNDSPALGSLNGKLNRVIADCSTIIGTQTAQNVTLGDIEGNVVGLPAAVAALGSPQQSGAAVTLPSPAPAGYGGADAWGAVIGPSGETAGTILNYAGSFAWQEFAAASAYPGSLYFVQLNPNVPMTEAWTANYPVFGPTLIVPGESALTCLSRLNPTAACSWYDGIDGHVQVFMPVVAQQNQWVTTFDQAEFDRMSFWQYTPASGPPGRSVDGDTNLLLSLIPLQYG